MSNQTYPNLSDNVAVPKRMSQVQQQIDRLGRSINILNEYTSQLEEKLVCIRLPSPKLPSSEEPSEEVVPFAETLREMAKQ